MVLGRNRAVCELWIASFLWGFSFLAAKWALVGFGPFWTSVIRFFLAFFLGLLITALSVGRFRKNEKAESYLKLSIPSGFLLGLTLLLQTKGLQYTTVTKASFLTTLYVVFVPLFDFLFFKTRIHRRLLLYIVLSLVGAGMICRVEFGDWNIGDVMMLFCAMTSACQILYIEKVGPRIQHPFDFNVCQSLYAAFLLVPVALFFEPFRIPVTPSAWFGVMFLVIGVSLVAFTIQVRTQKILPAATVSMFFLLESPIATFFAWLIFKETATGDQLFGGLLILVSAYGTLHLSYKPTARSLVVAPV